VFGLKIEHMILANNFLFVLKLIYSSFLRTAAVRVFKNDVVA